MIVPLVSDGKAVTAIGAKAFADRKTVLTVDLPTTVTSVGSGAFSGCEKLVSVNLTSACTSVGAYAFSGCGRLTSFGSIDSLTEISEGAFLGCVSLKSLTVPSKVTKIGAYAFSGCTALGTLSFDDAVSTVGNYALSDCSSLTEFRIPASLKSFGNGVLTGCDSKLVISGGNEKFKTVNGSLCEVSGSGLKLIKYIPGENAEATLSLPSSVTAIGANAFYGNDTLTVVNLSGYTLEAGSLAGLKSLKELTVDNLPTGNNAYLAYYFGAPNGKANGATGIFVPSSLEKVTVRAGQTALADYAFFGCTGLKTVEGISGISSIGAYAFAYTAIETLKLPASVSSIGEGAFSRCEHLSAFETEGNNRYYSVYDGCLYNKSYTELLIVPRQKETVEFHSGVKKIASGAFFKSRVTSVSVPASVTEIEASAFAEADHLESLEVPFIGGSADENRYMIYIFGGTIYETTDDDGNPTYSVSNSGAAPSSLTKLTVTGSLSEIPDFAFAYLENVSEFSLSGNITSIGIYGFYETGLTEVVIPSTVKKVGAYAYASMDKLETVTVPGSVGDGLGDGVFYSNRSLKVIRFEEGVTAIPFAACYPYSYYDRTTGYTVCNSSLEEIYLPSTLKTVGDRAFAYAGTVFYAYDNMRFTDLKFVMTPGEGLVELGDRAFYMSSIKSIALPASLEKVGSFCFSYCKQLSSVTFGSAEKGSALTTVGGACFAYCTGLNTLTIYKRVAAVDDVPVLEQYKEAEDQVAYNVFEGTVAPTIYVYGSEYYRKAANWDSYDMSIYEIK